MSAIRSAPGVISIKSMEGLPARAEIDVRCNSAGCRKQDIKIIEPFKISLQLSNICDKDHLAVAVKQLFNLLTVVPHADALLQHYGSRRNSANLPYTAYPDVLHFS
jgi:hypothetical protein